MSKFFKNNVIEPKELLKNIDNDLLRIIDCRWFIDDPNRGKNEYKTNHIPNAIFFDIENISDDNNLLPHMIPSKRKFLKFLRNEGISKKNKVVIYDQNGFFCSARVWFTFFLFGFTKISILNGGFNLWQDLKYIISNKKKCNFTTQSYDIKKKKNLVVDKEYVKKKMNDDKILIIDARSKKRFMGLIPEPRDGLKRGNIRNSINIPYTEIVEKNGKILNPKKLQKMFEKKINFSKIKEVICSCGSGITACNIIFALKILGEKKVKLYDGSWAEWGKN
jgi:thiosulfate/3-mercaptopyruvate sulfurtransferase|tara:strand:- start:427 stop:1257 length:831 start_codon:yes stop_codon:yes gene_type:complete